MNFSHSCFQQFTAIPRIQALFSVARLFALGLGVLGYGPAVLRAAPITLNFTGVGAGTYNGTAFTNAQFQVLFSGDIPSVNVGSGGAGTGFGVFGVPVSGTIAISGFTSATMTTSYPLYFNHPAAGWQLHLNSDSGGIFYVGSVYVNSWDTTTPLANVPFFLFGPGGTPSWSTDRGNIVFNHISSVTFGDNLGVLNPVVTPEPMSFVLSAAGLLLLHLANKTKKATITVQSD